MICVTMETDKGVDSADQSGVHGLGGDAASADQTRVQGLGVVVDSSDQSGVQRLVRVAVSLGDTLTLLLLNSLALPLIDIIAHLLGEMQRHRGGVCLL